MKLRNLFPSLALVLGLALSSAQATIIVDDNFDGYADQAAFQAAWPAIGANAPQSAVLSQAQASSPLNSVQVPGTTSGTSQYRNRRSFTDTAPLVVGDKIVWSFDYYDPLPSPSTTLGQPQRNYANLQDTTAPTGTNQLIAMGLNNNQTSANSGGNSYMARILGYTPTLVDPDGGPNEQGTLGSGTFFKLNDFGTGLRTQGWNNLKVEISTNDGLSTDYAFYVNDVLAELVSNVGSAATIRQYDNMILGSGLSNGGLEVFFDNVNLRQVPEPASLAVVGLMGLGLACVRTRR